MKKGLTLTSRLRVFIVLFVLVLLVPSPTLSAFHQPANDSGVYVDDMTEASVGLLSEETTQPDRFDYSYLGGLYFITAFESDYSGEVRSFIDVPPLSNTRLTIDITIAGDAAGKFALLGCRNVETNAGYELEFQPASGVLALWRIDPSGGTQLNATVDLDQLNPGFDFNTLTLECRSSTITGSVNGQSVVSTDDASYQEGLSYIGAGAYDESTGTLVAIFDNLLLEDLDRTEVTGGDADPVDTIDIRAAYLNDLITIGTTPPTTGPMETTFTLSPSDVEVLAAGVTTTSFYAEATFRSPDVRLGSYWTIGFCFWVSPGSPCTTVGIGVSETGTRWLLTHEGERGQEQIIWSGDVDNIDLTPGAANTIGLYVNATRGLLTINAEPIAATFDVNADPVPGDVLLRSFFQITDPRPDDLASIAVTGFQVWDLTGS